LENIEGKEGFKRKREGNNSMGEANSVDEKLWFIGCRRRRSNDGFAVFQMKEK